MFCYKCGCELEEDAVFCHQCGVKVITDEPTESENAMVPAEPAYAEPDTEPFQETDPFPMPSEEPARPATDTSGQLDAEPDAKAEFRADDDSNIRQKAGDVEKNTEIDEHTEILKRMIGSKWEYYLD